MSKKIILNQKQKQMIVENETISACKLEDNPLTVEEMEKIIRKANKNEQ